MCSQNFDITLVHSKLEESCYELAAYVDAYISDIKTEPVIDPKVCFCMLCVRCLALPCVSLTQCVLAICTYLVVYSSCIYSCVLKARLCVIHFGV
jgi:hypothetical protein